MEEKNQTNSQMHFIACETCRAAGLVNSKKCRDCHGFFIQAWTGSALFYWGKKINFLQITQDKARLLIKNSLNLALLLFGAAGAVMLGWTLLMFIGTGQPFWLFYRVNNWQMLVFWLSMLSNTYLYYRFNRDLEKIKHIPKKKYDQDLSIITQMTWAEAKNIDKDKKVDISKYFNAEAYQAITGSWQLAIKQKDEKVSPIHLLISLLTFQQTQIIFSRLGIPFDKLKNKIRNALSRQTESENTPVVFHEKSQKIIFNSYFLAYQLRESKVDVIDILQALVEQNNDVKELLYDLEITPDKVKNVIAWLRVNKQLRSNLSRFRRKATLKPKNNMDRAMTAIATPVLNAFGQDLTLLARAGYLVPCIARDEEIEEIFKIMRGGTRRSVVLTGSPGVGKNTIVEGIAQKMVEENVPNFLKDKRLVKLNVGALVSGVSASEAQQRLLLVLNEIKKSGNIILYVDDVSSMVGISAGRQGSVDLADVFSQNISAGSVLALATSTPEEYKKYIEGQSSLDDALEKLSIEEVTGNQAIQILESKVGAFEYKYNVFFSYDSIAEAVELSDKYLHNRYLPEKAIEILQEVASHVSSQKGKNAIVEANDVAYIISKKTNIPLTKITEEESDKLLNLEQKIHERIISQDEAVKMVSSSIRRARANMRNDKRPIVNLLFLGPTGVGKTELAKTVAEVYFGDEEKMIRLDMSEYQDKASINRLIGAPPGYGEREGGLLSEAVRKAPFSLVLLDEIEKAHPDILNIFLQILDDGRLTDNQGRVIDFTNTIIIATSNAGTSFIQEQVRKNMTVEKIKEMLIESELKSYFRPEFLNRFDGIIVFKPLTMEDVVEIAKLMLNDVKANLEQKGISLQATASAVQDIAQAGFDPQFGARPLRRVIQEHVQDAIANKLLSNEIQRRDVVMVEGLDKITVKKAREL